MANTTTEAKPLNDAERASERDRAAAEQTKRSEAAATASTEAGKLKATAAEDRAKVDAETDPAKKPALEKTARESAQKADDAAAKAAEANRAVSGNTEPSNISDAKVLGYGKDEAMPAGDHMAQKFGNDPANPKSVPFALPNGQSVPVDSNVRLSRKTPDHPGLVYTSCQPNMVGDYLRAGWNVDDVQPGTYAADAKVNPAPSGSGQPARPAA